MHPAPVLHACAFLSFLALLLSLQQVADAITVTTFTPLSTCDLSSAIAGQSACTLSQVSGQALSIQPQQAYTVPFVNVVQGRFQGIQYTGFSGQITASNPGGTTQKVRNDSFELSLLASESKKLQVFFMFGTCDTTASAAACMSDYYNLSSSGSPPASSKCNTNCFLSE